MVLDLALVDILKVIIIVVHGKTGLLQARRWFYNLNFNESCFLFCE